ncbi:MAG: tetratricopeptide repeat protein [Gammaproteobacteria bacterium]|nr:tetratricopeptide repeat protein [Gammaproteobacteria bacterium]
MQRLIILFFLFYSIEAAAIGGSVDDLRALVAGEDFSAAIKTGELLLKQNPERADVQFLTAYAYQMKNRTARATDLYRDLIRQHPELPEPRNNLAMIYLARGDHDTASKLLIEAINTHKSYATAHQNLSRIYTGIASEVYRRALSESPDAAKYTLKIELAALDQLELSDSQSTATLAVGDEVAQQAKVSLVEQVKIWARAWSNKDFDTYIGFYSDEHRPKFHTHRAWVEHRRKRIMRPGTIKVMVSDINIVSESENLVVLDFTQSFDSATYSDRVKKRLSFRRIGLQWKITNEGVVTVL